MSSADYRNLDNPVWHSILESHRNFGFDYKNIKFYHPDYYPFGGFQNKENIESSVNEYSSLGF